MPAIDVACLVYRTYLLRYVGEPPSADERHLSSTSRFLRVSELIDELKTDYYENLLHNGITSISENHWTQS